MRRSAGTDGERQEVPEDLQTQPTAVAEGSWAGPGGILPGPVVNKGHIWVAAVSPSRLWAMGSQAVPWKVETEQL